MSLYEATLHTMTIMAAGGFAPRSRSAGAYEFSTLRVLCMPSFWKQ
jgi:hypothetical protein